VPIRKSGDLLPERPERRDNAEEGSMSITYGAHVSAARSSGFASLLTAALLLLAAAPAVAQVRLEGRVVDAQQRPVRQATVVLVGAPTTTSTVTDGEGRFVVEDVSEGRYDLTATAPGLFGELRGVTVGGGATPAVEISVRISALSETLVVSTAQIDQPLSRTADSVTVLSGRDLERRQITTLGSALRTVPGFTVAQSGGPGTLTSLFPRGGDSDFALVLIDGIRANAFGGGLDLSQVPIADVDRIEVVRGPQSALYGADAIGGVVHVITRQGGAPSAMGVVDFGSRDTRRVLGSTTGSVNRWRWQAGADYVEDEGFTGVAPASGERVTNDDARERQGWVGGGWHGSRGTDVFGTFRYVDTDRGAPGPYGADPAGRFTGVDTVSRGTTARTSGGVRLVHPWMGPASRIRQRVDLDVADFDLSFVSPFGLSESETRRVHGRVQTDAALDGGFGVSAGVEWLTERARNTFITSGPREVPVDRRVIGTFGEARWNGHDRFSVQAGVRAEHIRRSALPGNPSPFSPRPDFADDTVVSINPKVSLAWLVSPGGPAHGDRAWTRVHLSAGTGIRPPDAFEIAFTDNPELKPERSRSLDAGVTQAAAGGAVQVDATVFFNRYDDLITSVGSLRDISRYRTDNVSNARARGVELGATWQAARRLGVRATYTFLATEILAIDGTAQAPSPYAVGDRLLRRPRHQGSLVLDYTESRTTVFMSVDARGTTLDAEPAFGPSGGLYENPGHGVIDLGGSFRIARGLEAFARVLNAFDRDYEEVLGFPSPGRNVFAGIRIAAGR
jgi:outer membrane cobalamin receptor